MEKIQETVEPLSSNEDNSFYRVVKTYVLRIGRMTQAQERDYNELSPVFCIPFVASALITNGNVNAEKLGTNSNLSKINSLIA